MSVMPSTMTRRATLADLAKVPGKAELIGGRIVHRCPTGHRPNLVAGRDLRQPRGSHARRRAAGEAYTDNMGFAVPELTSGRESFSPDVSYYVGPLPSDEMDFIAGPPTFAVEVRSKGDYGAAAEAEMAAKRADYFEAGTQVVWDVDPLAECVRRLPRRRPRPADRLPARATWPTPSRPCPGERIAVADLFA